MRTNRSKCILLFSLSVCYCTSVLAEETYHFTRWDYANGLFRPWAGSFPVEIEDGYHKYSLGITHREPEPFVRYGVWTSFGNLSLPPTPPSGFWGSASTHENPITPGNYPFQAGSIFNIDGLYAGSPIWLELVCRDFQDTGGILLYATCSIGSSQWLGFNGADEFNVQRGNHRISGPFHITYPQGFSFQGNQGGRGALTVTRRMALGYSGNSLALDLPAVDIRNQGETVIGTLSSNSTVTLRNSTFEVGGANSSTIGEFGGTGKLIIDSQSYYKANGAALLIGAFSGNGTVDVNGLLTCTQSTFVGYGGGTGRVNVSANREFKSLETISIGSGSGSTGTLALTGTSGNDAKVTARVLKIADQGVGTLSGQYGSATTIDHVLIGQAGGTANVNLVDTTISGGGFLIFGGSGTANVNVQGCLLDSNAGVAIGGANSFGYGAGGSGSIVMNNSRLFTTGQLLLGNQGAGTATIEAYNSQFRAGGRARIGLYGNASMSATNSLITLAPFDIGYGAGTGTVMFNRVNGTATELNIGRAGASGSFSLYDHSDILINGATIMGEGGTSNLLLSNHSQLRSTGTFGVGVHGGGTHTIRIESASTLSSDQSMTLGTLRPTDTILSESTLHTDSVLTNGVNGSIRGSGTIECNTLENYGFISPGLSPGQFTINGAFNNRAGEIRLEVGGTGNSDHLIVSGALTMTGGILRFVKLPGYTPQVGDQLDLIDAAAISITGGTIVDETGLGLQFNSGTGVVTVTRVPATVAASVVLKQWLMPIQNETISYQLKSGGNVQQSGTVQPNPAGLLSISTSLLGSHELVLRGRTWLSKRAMVEITPTGTTLSNFVLTNGDCNGDNVVDLTDYTILSVAFNAVASSPNWDIRADLNGDGVIDLSDYTIVVTEFNAIGE